MPSIANIQLGQCEVTYNSIDLGHTKGGCEVSISNDIAEVTVDKFGIMPVKAYHTGNRVEVTVTLSEYEYTILEAVINGSDKLGATVFALGVGGSAGAILDGAALLLHPVSAADTGLDILIFKAIPLGDKTLAFKVDEETTYEVTFLALVSEDDQDVDGNGGLIQFGTAYP